MKNHPIAIILLVLVPAIFLLTVPLAMRSGMAEFWKGFVLGFGVVCMVGIMVLAIVLSRR